MSDALPAEVWRTIPSWPEYSASSYGRIRRDAAVLGGGGSCLIPNGCLKFRALPRGHLQVTLCVNNTPKTRLVHRLIADAFLPSPGEGENCVLHLDDNPANNCPQNLRWGTRALNSQDMVSKNRQARGSKVAGCKLTPDFVLMIRQASKSGERQRDIAQRFSIAQSNVSLICSGKTWGHVQ